MRRDIKSGISRLEMRRHDLVAIRRGHFSWITLLDGNLFASAEF